MVKLNAIGDVVFATALVEALRAVHPRAEIDWLVGRHAEPILRGHPGLRNRILFDGPYANGPVALLGDLYRVITELRDANYDEAYLLHRSTFARLLIRGTRAPVIAGFAGRLAWLTLTHTAAFDPAKHETERYLDLLRSVRPELTIENPGMRLGLTAEAQVTAELLLTEQELPQPWFGLLPGGGRNPGAEMLFKRWPSERFAELGRRLVEQHGGSLIVCGSPDEAELCAEVGGQAGVSWLNACGRTTLPQLAALLARCDVVVGNDSGPLHIAAAVGAPTVALFGPTDPRLVAPLGPRHRYCWQPPECGPCYRPDNARGRTVWLCVREEDNLRCLRNLTAEQVANAVDEALRGVPWPAHEPFGAPSGLAAEPTGEQ